MDIHSGEAWLSGFGLASHLARGRQTPDPSAMISGTLAYLAQDKLDG